jgi:hypothetical protein
MGEKSNAYEVLVRKSDRWEGVDRIDLAQDREQWWALVNMVMKFLVP